METSIHGVLHAIEHPGPAAQVARSGFELQQPHHDFVHAFAGEYDGDFVDRGDIARRHHRARVHVAEQRDLVLHVRPDGSFAAAQQDIRLDTDGAQLLHAVLGGLGLQLLRGGDPGHQGHVHEDAIVPALLVAHLADGLQERQGLDVADGAADFDDDHIDVGGDLAHGGLDLVGDVRNDLDGLAEIIAAALAGDDLLVDAAGGQIIRLGELGVGEALVVPQIQVGLGAIVGDEDLAVLEGAHGAGVHVEVRIEFLQGHS